MQHVAATAWSPASDRKIYVVWIGVVWAAILAGFGMDFARHSAIAISDAGFARIWLMGFWICNMTRRDRSAG